MPMQMQSKSERLRCVCGVDPTSGEAWAVMVRLSVCTLGNKLTKDCGKNALYPVRRLGNLFVSDWLGTNARCQIGDAAHACNSDSHLSRHQHLRNSAHPDRVCPKNPKRSHLCRCLV